MSPSKLSQLATDQQTLDLAHWSNWESSLVNIWNSSRKQTGSEVPLKASLVMLPFGKLQE
jgi:hypothetical protein